MKRLLFFILINSFLISCEKEEKPMVLPPPGNLTKVVADIGTDYSKAIYISLANNTQLTRNWKDWDIAFEASESGGYIYLNTGKLMFACHTGSSDFATADSTGKEWRIDNDALEDDSTAIGKWWLNPNEVTVIDRGRVFYIGGNASQRYKSIKVEQVNNTSYTFSWCDYGSSNPVSVTIPKNTDHSLMYFTFDNGGHPVDMSPPKDQWDFVLTRYTHIYYGEPLNSIYRYYLVNGGLSNKWNGIKGFSMTDSTEGYIPFDQFTAGNAESLTYSDRANIIGFEWKLVDTNTGYYTIVPNTYYVLQDKQGFYYKIRFIDFYDDNGNRGVITFEYQRL